MKISLVIPTRERAFYLKHALNSARVAADRAGCATEIVVSDNASSDETPDFLSGVADARLVPVRSDRRLSMRENVEFALSHTTGSHIVFIGDDDAVLPDGLGLMRRIIEANDPDIVKWRVLNYLWANPQTGQPPSLKIRPQLLDGRLRLQRPADVLERFARADFRSYQEGGMIYHGCISRRLVDRAMTSGDGPYFRGSSPDLFTSVQALMLSDRPICQINQPITLGGASPRSNGAAGQNTASAGNSIEGTEFSKFVQESATDPWQCSLPAKCPSIAMVTLDSLKTAARVHSVGLTIDTAAWVRMIGRDLAKFDPAVQVECRAMAHDHLGLDIPESPSSTRQEKPAPPVITTQDARMRKSFSKLELSGGKTLETAETAAQLLNDVCDVDHASAEGFGKLAAVLRALSIGRAAERHFH